MSFKSKFLAASLALVLAVTFTACSDEGNQSGEKPKQEQGTEGQNAPIDSAVFSDLDLDAEISKSATKVALDGKSLTLTRSGEFELSGEINGGQLIIDADKNDVIQLYLKGVTISAENTAAIYVKKAKQVIITLADGSENKLISKGEFLQIDDNNVDGVIFSKSHLSLNGKGKLTASSDAGHGIVSKDLLKISGGSYTINAAKHGLSANDEISVAEGSFTLKAGTDGINVENLEDTSLGQFYASGGSFNINSGSDAIDASNSVTILGGSFSIASTDDAIHSDTDLSISGGSVKVTSSYEGLEGNTVTLGGGSVSLVSSDDGINAAGGNDESGFGGFGGGDRFGSSSDSFVKISGGKHFINAGGDGIDSNGAITVSGGELYISGPTNSGNGALDFGGKAEITGGTVVATGASGMAQNFSSANQGAILVNTGSLAAGQSFSITCEGKEIFSHTPEKAYSSIVVSTPVLEKGKTYTITAGSFSAEINLTDYIYGSGGFGGPGGGPGGFGGPGGGFGGGHGGFGERPNRP